MKFLDRLCCTFPGLTASAAGLLMLLDPVTTGERLHLGTVAGILVSLMVLLTGMATLCGLRRKVVSPLLLALVAAGLIVCLLTHHFRLAGWALILLPMAIYHLVYCLREPQDAVPAWFERVALGVFALVALAIPLDALVNLPRMEFGPYRVGMDVRKTPLGESAAPLIVIGHRVMVVENHHIIAQAPLRRIDSPRFQARLEADPDRVMADGIVAGRLYVAALAALFALLACVCAILKRHFLKEQPL